MRMVPKQTQEESEGLDEPRRQTNHHSIDRRNYNRIHYSVGVFMNNSSPDPKAPELYPCRRCKKMQQFADFCDLKCAKEWKGFHAQEIEDLKSENTLLMNTHLSDQNIIFTLEGKLREAVGALEFYAETESWNGPIHTIHHDRINDDTSGFQEDFETVIYYGGKLARETLKKIGVRG